MRSYQRKSVGIFARIIRRIRERKGIFVDARMRDIHIIDHAEIDAEKDPLHVNKVRWMSGVK